MNKAYHLSFCIIYRNAIYFQLNMALVAGDLSWQKWKLQTKRRQTYEQNTHFPIYLKYLTYPNKFLVWNTGCHTNSEIHYTIDWNVSQTINNWYFTRIYEILSISGTFFKIYIICFIFNFLIWWILLNKQIRVPYLNNKFTADVLEIKIFECIGIVS